MIKFVVSWNFVQTFFMTKRILWYDNFFWRHHLFCDVISPFSIRANNVSFIRSRLNPSLVFWGMPGNCQNHGEILKHPGGIKKMLLMKTPGCQNPINYRTLLIEKLARINFSAWNVKNQWVLHINLLLNNYSLYIANDSHRLFVTKVFIQ